MILKYLIMLVALIGGTFVFSFTFLSALICIRFGIPMTRRLEMRGKLKQGNPIVSNYIKSIILLVSIGSIITVLVCYFGSKATIIAYFVGAGFTFLKGLSQTGFNKNNWDDYLSTNNRYFDAKDVKFDEA